MLRKTIGKVIFGVLSNAICREVYYTDYRRSTIGGSTVYFSTVYVYAYDNTMWGQIIYDGFS